MSEVVVVARLKVQPGKVEDVVSRFTPVMEQSQAEEGCIKYTLHRDNNDPETLIVIERWRSQDDLNEHFGMPYMAEVGKLAGELLAEPPVITFNTPEPIGDAGKGSL